jgi:hypothetical protein
MNVGAVCTYNETRYGCDQVYAINPIRQGNFNNTMLCGAVGGDTFAKMTRPLQSTQQCPTGYVACSTFTNISNTVCVPTGT